MEFLVKSLCLGVFSVLKEKKVGNSQRGGGGAKRIVRFLGGGGGGMYYKVPPPNPVVEASESGICLVCALF